MTSGLLGLYFQLFAISLIEQKFSIDHILGYGKITAQYIRG
jgi:hypothetical protein